MVTVLLVLFPWSAFSTGTLALRNSTNELQRRQCVERVGANIFECDFFLPTLADLVARFRDANNGGRATPENSVWFYTNVDFLTAPVDPDVILGFCQGWMVGQRIPSYFIYDGVNTRWFTEQKIWIASHEAEFFNNGQQFNTGLLAAEVFVLCYYQAAAAAALASDAYLFTKADSEWDPGSIWATVEYPELTRNPNIKRIWRVDPRPGSPDCGQRVLMWDATHGDKPNDPPRRWTCPI
ncbi:hypothetical protein A1O1_09212 [Capronia coronata CBS 617.96]|uniref:Uncharacterized protein n=1 Tax=Capronia coronata CBS 617.96 TaxID=1182541 RepID=W9XNA5_9EURO|nr:uncharacterized protein A1O1_09212 [Capronia coronata CBS 617.96]EXJ78810.1 hypothetical protein A1O1_09212 [Capronia coronata CBS 617.96]